MGRHHRIACTINVVKPDTKSEISVDHRLDTAGTIDAPLAIDELSAQFLNSKNIGESSRCISWHQRTCIVCPGSRCAGDSNKLGLCQPPVLQTTFSVSTLLK